MIVILPSEQRVQVPDGVETLETLRQYLLEFCDLPPSVQHFYIDSSEVTDNGAIGALADDVAIDLVLQVGTGITICRAAMQSSLAHLKTEIHIPYSSIRKARRLDAFVGPPEIWLSEDQSEGNQQAAPFFQAFEEDKIERRRRLEQVCAQLEPGPIVISTFNWGFRDLVANWKASCDDAGVDCRQFTVLFPTDRQAEDFARDLGFQTCFVGGAYGDLPVEAASVFGDWNFRKMLFAKIAMTVDMLSIGGDFLRQDVDLVWHRDPRTDLVRRLDSGGLDMQFMYDGPSPIHQPLHYNSGFVFIRSNSFTRHMWKTVYQNYGRILIQGGEQRSINLITNCLRERGLRTGRLPERKYINGHVISSILKDDTGLPEGEYVVHASWTHNLEQKINKMKQLGLWYLK